MGIKMRSTIKDIAKDTNLSLATISKYLNNKSVLPENKILIEESIEKLGYIPNKTAQSLRSKKTKMVGIVIPELGNYFWGTVVTYVEKILRQHGYSTIVCSHERGTTHEQKVFEFLLDNQIAGVILIPCTQYEKSFGILSNNGIPVVCIDHVLKYHQADCVVSANFQGGYIAGEYLAKNNHKRIGLIAGEEETYSVELRVKGFREALNKYNVEIVPDYFSYGEFTLSSGRKQFKKIMSITPPPTALFFSSYDNALGALMEASTEGTQIPEDLSIISFDDDEIFEAAFPPITVLAQNLDEIATQATNLLFRRMSNDLEDFPTIVSVDTILIERDSVRKWG